MIKKTMKAEDVANLVICIAFVHRHDDEENLDSVMFCLQDAYECRSKGNYKGAANRALRSLAYSVSVAHEDYIAAEALIKAIEE